MNPLRRFLSRGGLTKQCLLFVIFTVMLSRALLSGAVMFDPDAPVGSFGLVICSGQGPMFDGASTHAAAATLQMHDGSMMDMSSMRTPSADPHTHAMSSHMDGQTHDDGICPFSAALIVAIAATAFLALLIGLIVVRRSWAIALHDVFIGLAPHSRPQTRAPPFRLI